MSTKYSVLFFSLYKNQYHHLVFEWETDNIDFRWNYLPGHDLMFVKICTFTAWKECHFEPKYSHRLLNAKCLWVQTDPVTVCYKCQMVFDTKSWDCSSHVSCSQMYMCGMVLMALFLEYTWAVEMGSEMFMLLRWDEMIKRQLLNIVFYTQTSNQRHAALSQIYCSKSSRMPPSNFIFFKEFIWIRKSIYTQEESPVWSAALSGSNACSLFFPKKE